MSYDGVQKCATEIALYQPRRAVIAPVLANLMQGDFAEGITAIARFWKNRWPLSCTIIGLFKRQKLLSSMMSNWNMSKPLDS